MSIDAHTRLCAVLGHPIRHSASPAMHNAAFAELGLNWRYMAFDVKPEELSSAILGAKTMGYMGLNLTVPHKLLAASMVDVIDEDAVPWGAVNTIVFEGRTHNNSQWRLLHYFEEQPTFVRTRGCNTDADAIITALRKSLAFDPASRCVLLLGAGGAGRTAALRIAQERPQELWLVNRTMEKAEKMASEIRSKHPDARVAVGYPPGKVDLVLNATSAGLKPEDSLPFDRNSFKLENATAAYDMIYRPAQTPFLRMACEAGCRTANGLSMLLYQGAKAFELWTGRPAPVHIMGAALERAIQP